MSSTNINESTIINVAICGLKKVPLTEYNARKHIKTMVKLYDKMEQYARTEQDSARQDLDVAPSHEDEKGALKAGEGSQSQKSSRG